MKVYRDLHTIQSKEKLGKRLSMSGLAVLFVGLVVNFTPNWFPPTEPAPHALGAFLQQYWTYISLASLFFGFLLASIGSYYINRFARRRWPGSKYVERPDEVLERSMKGFDNKYSYFAYSLPPNFALVGPGGIHLFAVRNDKGRITVNGDKWREPFSLGRIFTIFSREGVGNPTRDLEEQAGKLRALLQQAPGGQAELFADVPIDHAAVFLNQDARLEVEGPEIPVLRGNQVKDYVRRRAREVKLPGTTLNPLTDYLVEQASVVEAEE